MRITIRNGRLIDPAAGVDTRTSLHVADGRVAAVGAAPEGFSADHTIDASGLIVCPGLIDLQARLREPGTEHKGTIESETRAAAAGGVTTVCCPPDTDPVVDTAAVVELIRRRADRAGYARVLPMGALTAGLAGEKLSEMHGLAAAGCVAMSNAQRPVPNTRVLRRALEYAASLDMTVVLHAEDPWLGGSGCMHEGTVSARLGLPGIPSCAEVVAVARDLILIEQTGVRAHFGQISTARAADMIAEARQKGLPVTADVGIHHLFLTEMDVTGFDARCHVRPPLRTQRDRDGLREALADGVLDAICSDHQPHDADAKLAPFSSTEPGISGVETLLPLTLRLVSEGLLSLSDALARLTQQPSQLLEIDGGSLSPGDRADICIFDPEGVWEVNGEALVSHGKNTPFLGWEMKGRVTHTIVAGNITYQRGSI